MRDGEWVRFVIRFEILDLERFREMANAMVAVSRNESGTVVYDWYVDEQSNQGTLYEAYASREALDAHGRGAVFTELAPKYLDARRTQLRQRRDSGAHIVVADVAEHPARQDQVGGYSVEIARNETRVTVADDDLVEVCSPSGDLSGDDVAFVGHHEHRTHSSGVG